MAVPVIDYQQLAQSLLANIGAVPGAAPGAGGAHAASTAHYNGDHMDIERIESSMKKFLSDNCVDTNATVLQNIRTFLDHVPNVFKDSAVLYKENERYAKCPPCVDCAMCTPLHRPPDESSPPAAGDGLYALLHYYY